MYNYIVVFQCTIYLVYMYKYDLYYNLTRSLQDCLVAGSVVQPKPKTFIIYQYLEDYLMILYLKKIIFLIFTLILF